MTLRLISLTIDAQPGGLQLPEQKFSEFLTHVHGENGTGKTAVMCALYWALGGARQVDDPLWTKCSGVRLRLTDLDGREVTLYRAFSDQFDATVNVAGTNTHYDDEAEWSDVVLPMLGVTPREWSAKGGGIATSYLNVVLPAFAVDQDKGWIQPYAAFSNKQFIEDQSQEVVRLMLGLPQRHDPKRDKQKKKLSDEVERLEREIATRNRTLDSLAKSLPTRIDALDAMKSSRERLLAELKQFDAIVSSMAQIDASLRGRVDEAVRARDAAARELADARHRKGVLERLRDEGYADIDLVGTNEVAADAFRRFCGNPSCQFFAGKAEPSSYGRRLLYLRDQFKDILAAMDAVGGVLQMGAARLATAEEQLTRLRAEHEAAARLKATDQIVAAIEGVTKQLAGISKNIALTEEIAVERRARDKLTEEHAVAHADLTSHNEAETRRRKSVATASTALAKALMRWMEILNANDVGSIGVDEDLRVTVKEKVLTDTRGPSGSSRLRLILAYHAALLEVSFQLGGAHPPLLLFDAPKQHELNHEDFGAYMTELRKVFVGKHVQIVISSRTEIPKEKGDATWSPAFPGEKHPWFLGPISKST